MRMKKLLMFLVLLTVSVGTWAYTGSGTNITLSEQAPDKQVITIAQNSAGALADWFESLDATEKGKFADKVHLKNLVISGPLNAADLAVLNTSTDKFPELSKFETVDMSGVILETEDAESDDYVTPAQVCAINFSSATYTEINNGGHSQSKTGPGAKFIRLPKSMTSAEDVAAMAKMKDGGKNSNLKMVGAYDPDNSEYDLPSNKWAKVSMHSFEANKVTEFINTMNIPVSGNPNPVPREIRMSGEYGDKDLVNNNTPNFGHGTSAIWDFTGAHFADCTIADATQTASYYNYDDPFCLGELVACPTTTNSFYYFNQYKNQVIDIKLPDNNMTHLPFRCLNDLASGNKSGYVALYGQTAFDNNKEEENCVPIESLRIPDCYTDLDEECGKWARNRHLIIGSNMKRIHGGAFLKCDYLEDLDFAAGLSDCYIGDRSFNECKSMKHIALSEGIVSLGNGCFWNSQHLESIRLPQSLINMGNNCFNNCLALNSITIPENVEKIGQNAFTLCPFTDIYLTTTDPTKIPFIWSCGISEDGNGFGNYDGKSTFYHMHLDGWDGIPDTPQKAMLEAMNWDQAVEYYYTHVNGIPVLHYPKALADQVRAQISETYEGHSSDGYGLPFRSDMFKRSNVIGADLGTIGQGKYTQDGWAQFMLMKEFTTDPGGDVFKKYYEDVWYTICFPFDLTDEQLAAAFNETFNIVDFSGVEVMEKDDPNNKLGELTLTLHFNTVANTYYRDNEGNEYTVIGREKDETSGFNYNIYRNSNGVEYHHSQVSSFLSSNKTKTFAPGNSIAEANANKNNAIFIDGYLATAGHPYMIHPAIGTSKGNPRRCDFSGITWKPMTQWTSIYEAQKRVVDLGVPKGSFTGNDINDHSKWTPDADNYMQPEYSNYIGQTYTFIGNPSEFDADAIANSTLGDEPEVPEMPVPAVKPSEDEIEALKPSEILQEPHATVDNPETNNKYTESFKTFYNTVRCSYTGYYAPDNDQNHLYEFTYGEDLITYDWQEFFNNQEWYNGQYGPWYLYNKTRSNGHNINYDNSKVVEWNLDALEDYLGEGPLQSLTDFTALKQLAMDYNDDKTAYAQYESDRANYIYNRAAWAYYNAQKEILDNWDQEAKDQEYQTALQVYNTQKSLHDQWVEDAKSYQVLIPTGAYFLGRKGTDYPKYYREIASDTRPVSERKGGFWTQFTAVIIPNAAALSGIETKLGPGIANNTKGLNMVFDEGFMGEFDATEIKDIIAEAEEKGEKVQYMNIVYNINGEIVGRGSQSLSNLPQGMYIINGKKYLVK